MSQSRAHLARDEPHDSKRAQLRGLTFLSRGHRRCPAAKEVRLFSLRANARPVRMCAHRTVRWPTHAMFPAERRGAAVGRGWSRSRQRGRRCDDHSCACACDLMRRRHAPDRDRTRPNPTRGVVERNWRDMIHEEPHSSTRIRPRTPPLAVHAPTPRVGVSARRPGRGAAGRDVRCNTCATTSTPTVYPVLHNQAHSSATTAGAGRSQGRSPGDQHSAPPLIPQRLSQQAGGR